MPADDARPVVVGLGVAGGRVPDPGSAPEPLELMRRALWGAGRDSGAPALLRRLGDLAVPRGRWDYGDPARLLAGAVGAPAARTVLADVGVLQQTLIARACDLVAAGEVEVAAVVGGDAGARLRHAEGCGRTVADTPDDGVPDLTLSPGVELRVAAERRAGLGPAAGCYAIVESAVRHRHGWSVAEGRDRSARLSAALAAESSANPHAWRPGPVAATAIRDPGPDNPMLAFPYTRRHVTDWGVDQAAALLFCSAATARRLGVPEDRFVHPLVGVESNATVPLSARPRLDRPLGLDEVAGAVRDHTGAAPVDLVELYSCFPVAVRLHAEAFGLAEDRPLTVTGGMPSAGGPYNNYVLQATCRMAGLLRTGRGTTGLVTCVSGPLTKHGAAVWSTVAPDRAYTTVDVTDRVRTSPLAVVDHAGRARVAGYTVLRRSLHRSREAVAVAVLDVDERRRAVAVCTDPRVVASMEAEEWVGRRVEVRGDRFSPDDVVEHPGLPRSG